MTDERWIVEWTNVYGEEQEPFGIYAADYNCALAEAAMKLEDIARKTGVVALTSYVVSFEEYLGDADGYDEDEIEGYWCTFDRSFED